MQSKVIHISLSQSDYDKLKDHSKSVGLNPTQAARSCVKVFLNKIPNEDQKVVETRKPRKLRVIQ